MKKCELSIVVENILETNEKNREALKGGMQRNTEIGYIGRRKRFQMDGFIRDVKYNKPVE